MRKLERSYRLCRRLPLHLVIDRPRVGRCFSWQAPERMRAVAGPLCVAAFGTSVSIYLAQNGRPRLRIANDSELYLTWTGQETGGETGQKQALEAQRSF
jgi:hypothetical protein